MSALIRLIKIKICLTMSCNWINIIHSSIRMEPINVAVIK